ncbi:MAG: hydantoinase/oxoprolinase family protein [Betaproteobacteria bacterium]|nr:hydantoinase/oxoprolinase family protein [Betaproteobacteria bacterium]
MKKPARQRTEKYEIGVDIGGTFTDVVAFGRAAGRLAVAKVLTDHADLARGVIAGIQRILEKNRIDPGSVTRVVHGTTLVTNSLIERRGAKTALIVTRGFGDVLEMGRESRYDIYDIDIDIPAPIVARELVFEVTERLDFKGGVLTPLDESDVDGVVAKLREFQVQSAAVCLLHSYADPVHEARIAEILTARLPGLSVSLSSDVMPDLREYERASTTAANAYVKPVVKGYLDRLRNSLRDIGAQCQLSIMTSDGGVIDVDTAARFPVRLAESGPAGGATAASFLGAAAGVPDVIAYDMGGTTAKICVIEGGKPLKTTSFEFGRVYRFAKGSGLPLQIPAIEMIEIGAGGGSIAHVNALDMLQIGPESANASPGPACYGLGGTRATVSDADLVLGYLAADSFLGGAMRLDEARARAAIDRDVAKPLGMSVEDAAYATHRVVNANMARAAKVHCFEHGKDPRRFALFAYGGAGPVHAFGVAQLLGIRELVYPLRAGVMSALGFLVAEPSFEVLHGRISPLFESDLAAVNGMLTEMEREATRVVLNSMPGAKHFTVSREVAVRYEGQSYELYVPFSNRRLDAAELKRIARDFTAAYSTRYHAVVDHGGLECVRWRVRVTTAEGARGAPRLQTPGAAEKKARKGRRGVFVPEAGRFLSCPVYDRYALPMGTSITGPAIVEEPESTVYVGSRARAFVTHRGDLRVALKAAARATRRVTRAEAPA